MEKDFKFKAAVFDLDGTLAYTMNDLADSMNAMLRSFGYPERTHEQLLGAINGGARNFVRRSMPSPICDDENAVDACYKVYDKIYGEHFADNTPLYDGIYDCVMKLRRAGLKLAVLSNKQQLQTAGIIGKLFPPGVFDCVMGQSVYPTKPDKTGTLALLDCIGCAPENSVEIGDSDVDVATALNAGMFSLGITWGYRGEDVLRNAGAMQICGTPAEVADFILAHKL
ncbi:MAG: HAD family hydrolase [Eubacteriales bacterium]